MKQKVTFKHLHDIPPISVSLGSMDWNKTGSWRYLRPRYVSRIPPCNEACPAGNDVEGFLVLTREGKLREAWELIREENPFPGVCGRVCFHPCESSCNRREFDEPLAIHEIERFLADRQFQSKREHHSRRRKRKESVAVIGSGPAGLTCAYHLSRLGYGVTVFEAESSPGGILRHGIPEYRLPRAIVEHEIADIQSWGVEIKTEVRIGKNLALENLRSFQAVFIATGAHGERTLNIEGAHLAGVFPGLQVLRELRLGRLASLGKKVSVIGGGNSAIDVARSALRLGAETVQIFYRRSKEEMPAFPDEVEEALREGVQIHYLVSPVKITGDGTKATGMDCVRMRLGEADESGRRRPIAIEGARLEVPSDTIVAAIGEFPDLTFLPQDVAIQGGRVAINGMGLAHSRGIFAGGDAALPDHTVAVAIGSGKKAALAIHEYLEGKETGDTFQSIRVGEKGSISLRKYFHPPEGMANPPVIPFQEIHTDYFDHRPRVRASAVPLEERRGNFHEVHLSLAEQGAVEEASRCFNCGICNQCDNCWTFCPDMAVKKKQGHYEIDYDYCKGCGICFEECPRGAVLLEEETR
jgi:2-oxoacid:acceptor oxidoreductase delta subunit (pyruvate/2-ketoisovalerate family)